MKIIISLSLLFMSIVFGADKNNPEWLGVSDIEKLQKKVIKVTIEPPILRSSLTLALIGSISVNGKRESELSYIPKKSFIKINEKRFYTKRVALDNVDFSEGCSLVYTSPKNIIIKGTGEIKFRLLFDVKPENIGNTFYLHLGDVLIDEKKVIIPRIKIQKEVQFIGFIK